MTALPSRPRVIAVSLLAFALFATAWSVRMCAIRRNVPDLSPLARRAVRESPEPLRAVAGAVSVVYAADPRAAAAMIEEADYAVIEISRRLGVAAPTSTVHILLTPGVSTWTTLARAKGFRPDSLALNAGREILLRDDPEQSARPDRLAHELTHFVLRETFGEGIPLWLDEGLAAHVGFAVSRAFRTARGRRMAGAWPGLSTAQMEPLEVLTSRTSLPDDAEEVRLFYRASEELVAWIEDRLGAAGMREFIAETARGALWREALGKRLNTSHFSTVELEEEIRRAVESPKKR